MVIFPHEQGSFRNLQRDLAKQNTTERDTIIWESNLKTTTKILISKDFNRNSLCLFYLEETVSSNESHNLFSILPFNFLNFQQTSYLTSKKLMKRIRPKWSLVWIPLGSPEDLQDHYRKYLIQLFEVCASLTCIFIIMKRKRKTAWLSELV